jgi:hypothetical protein
MGVVAFPPLRVGHAHDEVVGGGAPGRVLDLGHARAGAAIGDVVPDRPVHQHRFLADHAELRAERSLRQGADVAPVDEDAPTLNVEEPEHQVDDRGLARAGRDRQAPRARPRGCAG